jgi:Flp pilus assembly protein TadD
MARAQSDELTGISTLIQQGKLQEAEQRLHRYLIKLPHSAKANNLLGVLLLRQGHFAEAEGALQKAIAAAPGLLEARLNLGDAYLAEGKLDSALTAYEGATKIAPHDVRAELALAKLYLGAGEFAKSIEAAGNIPPEKRTEELLPMLAADYFGLRQPEKAGVEIQAMLEVAQKQPDLVPELAEFFLAHRDFQSSQQLLALAQSKQPSTDRLLVDLARTQAGLGQLDDAQKTLESILERRPDFVEALSLVNNRIGVLRAKPFPGPMNWLLIVPIFCMDWCRHSCTQIRLRARSKTLKNCMRWSLMTCDAHTCWRWHYSARRSGKRPNRMPTRCWLRIRTTERCTSCLSMWR